MRPLRLRRHRAWPGWACALGMLAAAGCGTTRMSDSQRTGTEQLLLSNAVDRSINDMNLQVLAGREVYFDPQYLKGIVDENYVVSSLRQALLANGCYLKEKREEATYIVEARAGAVGTNRHELLIGIPAFNLPNYGVPTGVPTAMPEIPFAKSSDQMGVAKLSVYAYNRETGEPIWQSGAFPFMSSSKDTWVLGTGPFQKGSIHEGTRFAGSKLDSRFWKEQDEMKARAPRVSVPVTAEAVFPEHRTAMPKPPADAHAEVTDETGPSVTATSQAKESSVTRAAHILRLPPTDKFEATVSDAKSPPPRMPAGEMEKAKPLAPLGEIFRPLHWFGRKSSAEQP